MSALLAARVLIPTVRSGRAGSFFKILSQASASFRGARCRNDTISLRNSSGMRLT